MEKPASGSRSAAKSDSRISKVFSRYALVGLLSNAFGYGIYLIVTWLGASPKAAMSLLYFAGAALGFFGNRLWAFAHHGKAWPSLLRYGISHSLGYGLNFALLHIFVDKMNYPHQLVQAVAIAVVAVFLFVSFRFFVFPKLPAPTEGTA